MAHNLTASLYARTTLLGKRVHASVTADRLIRNDLSSHLSRHVVYLGIGFEQVIVDNLSIRPSLRYGVPVGRDFSYFKMYPLNWGIEFVRRID